MSQHFLQPRAFAQRLRGIAQPTLLLHGDADRLVPVAASRQVSSAKPTWTLDVAAGVGHIPMMEAPVWTLERITRWLGAEGAPAVRASAPVGAGSRVPR
jgi:pimeloyl-ACP methyl ester carboxylesterase